MDGDPYADVALEGIPDAVRGLIDRLVAAGHEAYLVGGAVRDLLRGESAGDFDITTAATPQAVLEIFPRAVPIGIRHGTVMVPTPTGPVDITTFRGGPKLEDDLGHRDFTVNAIAYDPRAARLIDPFGGRDDLGAGRLRGVRSAKDRFAEDPLRALRAARLRATLRVEVDPEVETAMRNAASGIAGVARERIRRELERLLLGSQAGPALDLLRRSGIEAELAPGAAPDAGAVVAALPLDLDLRLAAWLRGSRAARVLRRMRFPRRTADHVSHLLRLHPVEAGVHPERDASVRRLLKRAGEDDAASLIALRRAELLHGAAASDPQAEQARERVDALAGAVERVRSAGALALRRFDLAIDGREVMELLGCGPGRQVGHALRHLTEQVIEDPAHNTPAALRKLLAAWAKAEAER